MFNKVYKMFGYQDEAKEAQLKRGQDDTRHEKNPIMSGWAATESEYAP
jgi:hypothetical protein